MEITKTSVAGSTLTSELVKAIKSWSPDNYLRELEYRDSLISHLGSVAPGRALWRLLTSGVRKDCLLSLASGLEYAPNVYPQEGYLHFVERKLGPHPPNAARPNRLPRGVGIGAG